MQTPLALLQARASFKHAVHAEQIWVHGHAACRVRAGTAYQWTPAKLADSLVIAINDTTPSAPELATNVTDPLLATDRVSDYVDRHQSELCGNAA